MHHRIHAFDFAGEYNRQLRARRRRRRVCIALAAMAVIILDLSLGMMVAQMGLLIGIPIVLAVATGTIAALHLVRTH